MKYAHLCERTGEGGSTEDPTGGHMNTPLLESGYPVCNLNVLKISALFVMSKVIGIYATV